MSEVTRMLQAVENGEAKAAFVTTHWSLVLAAGGTHSPQAAAALEALCRAYWDPLYAYIRRRGYGREEAEDLTQAFFAFLLEKQTLAQADPERGRFRTFLLTSLSHFLHGERVFAQAQKRGGGQLRLSLEELETEEQLHLTATARSESPEQVFDRRWAQQLLAHARANLRQLYEQDGKLKLFERLAGYLDQETDSGKYVAEALDLEMTPGAVRTAVHRLRHRYGQMIRGEVARTVGSEADVEGEYQYLRELVTEL